MKLVKLMMMAIVAVAMVSCSGYSESTCKELSEKIRNNEELSQSDYSAMLDQLEGMIDKAEGLIKKYEDNPSEMLEDEDVKNITTYSSDFSIALATGNLDESNKEKYRDLIKKIPDFSKYISTSDFGSMPESDFGF